MDKPVYLISDVHAGIRDDAGDAAKLADFRALVLEACEKGRELVLLGDVFDFWFEWKEAVPKRHFRWLEVLRGAVRSGLPVSLFPGNHDFRLQGFLEEEIGLRLPGESERRILGGRRALLHHGDGLDDRELGYRLLRGTLHHPLAQRLFGWLHPDWGMRLADRMGAGDRDHVWSGAELAGYLRRALPATLREDDELAVFGHVHVASRSSWRGCEVRTLPPFLHPSRGFALLEGGVFRAAWRRPELAPAELELGDVSR